MTGRLQRFFLAEPPGAPPPAEFLAPGGAGRFVPPVAAGPPRVGNAVALATARDVEMVAGGLAAGLRGGGRPLVACVWPAEPGLDAAVGAPAGPTGLPAFPAAGRVAERLRDQGLAAAPAGLVALVALDGDPVTALAEVRRAELVAGGPVALVLGRRDPALDGLVREAASVVLVAGDDAVLTGLAFEELRRLHADVTVLARPASPVMRLQCRLGLCALRPAAGGRGGAAPACSAAGHAR